MRHQSLTQEEAQSGRGMVECMEVGLNKSHINLPLLQVIVGCAKNGPLTIIMEDGGGGEPLKVS